MADDRGRGLPPPRDLRDDPSYPPPPQGDEDDRSRPYQPHRPGMGLTLPSIHDSINAYGQPPPASRYPPAHHADPRASGSYGPSPAGTNGYSAPPPGPTAPPQQPPYLPPVHDGRPPQPGYPPDPYARPAYPQGYDYRQPPGPYGPDRGYPPDYGRGPVPNAPAMQPGAPRQRTSIACKYCRRRKIRCSGYANAPGGKCTNCVKMNQECIFQPVSTSAAATAFVPISAVQGNLPPGTPMYGAYGQPLPHAPPAPPAHYPPASGEYPPHPMQSPTAPYPPAPSYGEHDRRRPREDDHMPPRLPPPNHPYQEDPRRRSPATPSTNSPGAYSSYPPPTAGYDGGSTPTQRGSPGGTAPNQSSAGPGGAMSLANIMDGPPRADATREIDQDMLGRLNRRPQ